TWKDTAAVELLPAASVSVTWTRFGPSENVNGVLPDAHGLATRAPSEQLALVPAGPLKATSGAPFVSPPFGGEVMAGGVGGVKLTVNTGGSTSPPGAWTARE